MIYVMSDIHGNLPFFRSVMRQIRLRKNDTLYILGDVIDRHPDGIKILKYIMKKANMRMLLGNHEYTIRSKRYTVIQSHSKRLLHTSTFGVRFLLCHRCLK